MSPAAPPQPRRRGTNPARRMVRVSAPLVRVRGPKVDLTPPPKPKPVGPPKVARMLALGHEIVRLIDAGLLEDLADAAELLGFSRARVTQIVDLTLLAPDIQEALLVEDGGTGQAERRLRAVVAAGDWAAQREKFRTNTVLGGARVESHDEGVNGGQGKASAGQRRSTR